VETVTQDGVVEVLVTFRMKEADHKRIMDTKQDFASVANFMVEQYANGGVMVRADHARYLSTLAGRPVKTSETVVDIVESGVNRNSPAGYLSVTYNVDPAYAMPLEELSRQQGRSVEAIVQEAFHVVLTNGWLYDIRVDGMTINLTKEMRIELESITKQKITTGASLMEWIKERLQPNAKMSKLRQEVRERMGISEGA